MKKLNALFSFVVIVVFITGAFLYAHDRGQSKDKDKGFELAGVTGLPRSTLLNVNNMSQWWRADGRLSRDPRTGNSGVFFPRGLGTNAAVIFADGIVWGGLVNDDQLPVLRAGGNTFSVGMLEGKILSPGVAEDPNAADVRIWRVRRDFPTADLTLDADEMGLPVDAVRAQYATDWREWPWEKGAPWTGIDNLQDSGYLGPDGETIMGAGNGILDRGEDANMNAVLDAGEDANGNGVLDGEVPGIVGADQVVWTVTNDLSPGVTFQFLGSPPIGFEIQMTGFAFSGTGALGNMVFKQVKLIYKGTEFTPASARIDSMFWTQWVDPDLGTYSDDFVGVDTTLSLGFVYNSSSVDNIFNGFGLPPPAAGYDFFQGVLVPGVAGEDRNKNGIDDAEDTGIFNLTKTPPGFINLPMRSFGFFAAGSVISDPPLGERDGTIQWWNLLRGFIPLSDPLNPTRFTTNDGTPTLFPLAGDPVAAAGDLDGIILPPSDRRFLLTTGPFTLALGDTQELVISLMVGLGSDRLSSVAVLKFFDRTAQATFDNLFQVVKAPPNPTVKATGLNGQILLNWGFDPAAVAATESQEQPGGFKFEGYNVYQLRSSAPSLSADNAIKLATFDVVNEITTVLSEDFDVNTGVIIERPAQVGSNSGIKRVFTVTTDAFRDKPLANDQDFFFAVTAYNATEELDQTVRAFESPPNVITVRAQVPNPGFRLAASAGEILDVTHIGPSDGTVTPIVIEAPILTGDEYKITFDANEDGETIWNLTNVTKNEILLSDQTNQSGDDNFLITDGFQAKVSGPPPGIKPLDMFDNEDSSTWGWDIPSGARRFTWANADFGFEGFRGAMGWGSPFRVFITGDAQPSPIPATELKPVLLVLATVSEDGVFDPNDPNVSHGYRYLRSASSPPAQPEFVPFIVNPGPGYAFQDFTKSVPLAAFDISDPDNPRRLVVGHLENNRVGGLVDGKYFPDGSDFADNVDGDGPREWLFVFDADYSATQNPEFSVDILNNDIPVMYWSTAQRRGGRVPWSPGGTGEDQFAIFPGIPNSQLDEFTWTTPAPSFDQATQKKDALDMVGVFPNPYLGFNRLETSSQDRFIRFNHLPEQATIRIFNLAGTFVRKLEKSDPSPWLDWDLTNEDNLPVASGLYIAHIEMPGVGEKNLKLAIVQEQQFLDTF